MSSSTYKFRRNIDIGSLAAEDDKFLKKAFVDKNDLGLLKDMDDSKCILLGRTGTGKSALIQFLEQNESKIARIDPESISLRHLSNSDIINYFKKLDVKLDLFYKVLWKHVFIVELIKLYFDNDLNKSKGMLDWLKERFPNKAKKKSIEYLEKWEDRFWQSTEYRIRELETSLEDRFKGEFAGNLKLKDIIQLSSKAESEHKDISTTKYEVINKAQKVVNESQIEHIRNIVDLMKTQIFNKKKTRYFIVIDDLDKEWVSNEIVYDLIKSLVETIKEFSQIPSVKIIIALRTNIHKKIFKTNSSRGVQREKFNHLYLNIEWSENEIKELLNNRIRELMRGTYTTQSPKIDDILPEANKKQVSGIDYILARTFLRPRDAIDFFNKCIYNADGKTKFSREIIKKAENEYSRERIQALNDEWLENYGHTDVLYGFLKGKSPNFTLGDVEEEAETYFLEVVADAKNLKIGKEVSMKFTEFSKTFDTEKLLKEVLVILYEIGLIGIKLAPDKKLEYFYQTDNSVSSEDLGMPTKFKVHPMFNRALRIREHSS